MNVSAADIIVAHIVVFGERAPGTTTFKDMAARIVAAKPKSWQKLMQACEQERAKGDLKTPYEDIAKAVSARGFSQALK